MAVAYDAQSAPTGGGGAGDQSWTHTPVGTPRAVIVVATQLMGASSVIDAGGVSYGGVPVPAATSALLKATGEAMGAHLHFLGSGIPVGAQAVNVDAVGANFVLGRCYTLTAAADTELVDLLTISSDSVANPSGILALSGRAAWALAVLMSGQNADTGITPLSGHGRRARERTGQLDRGACAHAPRQRRRAGCCARECDRARGRARERRSTCGAACDGLTAKREGAREERRPRRCARDSLANDAAVAAGATLTGTPSVVVLNARGRGSLTADLLGDGASEDPAVAGTTVTFWLNALAWTRVTQGIVEVEVELSTDETAKAVVDLLIQ